ncbi:MAG: hypothetical protein RL033_7196 [Pseudomonadota bacterium]|jgi:sugar lactone lactonase YvrE
MRASGLQLAVGKQSRDGCGSWAWLAALALLGALACGSDDTSTLATETGSASPAAEARFITFDEGEPASVYWSNARSALYVADNQNNQIWKWTEVGGLEKHATTLASDGELEAGATLVGQLVELDDGTLVVTRFGQPGGGFSAIAWLRPDGSSGLVPGLNENVKRLGVAQAPDGTIYGTYFGRNPSGMGQVGTLTRVDLEAGETVIAEGFGKLIGLAIVGDDLFVSDQSSGILYDAPLAALPARAEDWNVFARLPVPDQVCAGPGGTIFSGQFQAAPDSSDPVAIRQIQADGSVTKFAQDPDVAKPSGVAYDPTARRLFATDTGNVTQIGVHIFPVP